MLKGDEDVDDWIADFELFMLTVLQMTGDEAKLQTLPLVSRGKAKAWFDALEDVHKQTWIIFREHFLQRFEAYWGDFVAAIQATNAGYFNPERFLSCLHPYVCEKVDYEDPKTVDEAV
ncbi:hypothetical protein GOP47_0006669 [Adiantum capillus-veneris]|uniref:Retrotransposon gag domain-containing protein n=1 Tax=Adiantum capillus-veneris TaxID=13818 RepID=A0A9D4ZKH7_ADICA|nr:hypothetical protein GOP47_0006669 [Adiantum capillus-veneris]